MAIYYVAPNGTDSGTSGPFKTIQYGVAQLESGDILIVRDGTYSVDVRSTAIDLKPIVITQSNVTVRADNELGAIINGSWETITSFPHTSSTWSKRYSSLVKITGEGSTLDGFVLRNSRGRGVTVEGNDSIVQNCKAENIFNTAIQSYQANNVTIQYNHVNNASRQRIWKNKSPAGFVVDNHPNVCALVEGTGGTLRGNVVHDSGGEGIDVFRNQGGALVEGNISYNNSSVQLYINRVGNGLIMRNNIAFQTKPASQLLGNTSSSQPGGIDFRDENQSATFPASTNVKIYNNLIINCHQCLWLGSQANLKDMVLANNTFIQGPYTTRGVIRIGNRIDGTKNWSGSQIINNIFHGNTYEIADDAALISWSNNCFYPGTPPAIIQGLDDVYTNPNFANLVENPTFNSLNTDNYKLLVTSPCIDTGVTI